MVHGSKLIPTAISPSPQLIEQMLDRYLDFAENAEPAYRLIMSGGLGNDPVAREFISA
jgi:hypothetical protein